MEPYKHKDYQGDMLTVVEHEGRPGSALVRCSRPGVEITTDAIPAVTSALYEACGDDSPLLIPRQQVPENGGPSRYGDFVIGLEGDRVAVGIHGIEGSAMPPGAAMVLSGYIAAYARLAQEEPDPAEVDELAAEMHRERENCGGAGEWDRQAARTALRWMNARKAAASAAAADEAVR